MTTRTFVMPSTVRRVIRAMKYVRKYGLMIRAEQVTTHAAAVEFRRQEVEQKAPKMPDLNGKSIRFWVKPVPRAECYAGR